MRYSKFIVTLLVVFLLAAQIGASTAQAVGTVYIVQRGDTLYRIAARYGSTVDAIAATNGIANPNRIYVGQRLTIPGAVSTPTAPTYTSAVGSGVYIVQPGDTLHRIALRYGTTVPHLAAINSIANPSLIYVGQRIRLSGTAAYTTCTPPVTTQPTTQTTTTTQSPRSVTFSEPRNGQRFSDTQNIHFEWTPIPGAFWYRLHVHRISDGVLYESLWFNTGEDVNTWNLAGPGTYHYYVIAMDRSEKELARSAEYEFVLDNVFPRYSISFWVSDNLNDQTLLPGECAVIHWDVSGVDQVYFGDTQGFLSGVPGESNHKVCYEAGRTRPFYLEVLLNDGTRINRSLTVTMNP